MFKTLIKAIKDRFILLMNPEIGIQKANRQKFEKSLHEYLILLIAVSVAAGVFIFVSSMLKGLYYDLFYEIDVHYWNMANYALGRANGLIFLYFFSGTFILFFVSLLLNPFLKRVKYVKVLQMLFISMTPLLLFGWVPVLSLTLIVWGIFLFALCIRITRDSRIKISSIKQRD